MSNAALDLERVIASAAAASNAAPGSAEHALLESFVHAFLQGVDDLPAGGERVLAAAVTEGLAFAREHAPGALRVRVDNPDARPGRTRIQVLQDDRPFIVDTARLVLRREGLRERVLLHPILQVQRDAAHLLTDVSAAAEVLRESQLYIEVAPRIEDPERLAGLEATLVRAMEQVRDVVADHAKMIRVTRELEAQVEFAARVLADGAERARRVTSFLAWLAADHFVFMGVRRYTLRVLDDGGFEVRLVPGSGLGLFRDDATSRLREPVRGDAVPDELRDILDDPRILVIGKSRVESPVHRHGRLDRVAVTEYDERGRPIGLAIVFGLFTSSALRTPGSQVPILASRLEEVLRREGAEPRSHRYRAVIGAFDSAPLEVLLGTDLDGVAELIHEIVDSEGSTGARLVLRADRHGRTLYVAVLLPRARYGEDLRARIRALLDERTGATYMDDRASFLEEGGAVIHYFCTSSAGALTRPDAAELERDIALMAARWEDRFEAALTARLGEIEGARLADRYEDAFPEALRVVTHADDAVRDALALEALAVRDEPQFTVYFDAAHPPGDVTILKLYLPESRLLSELLPVVDGFGIRVVDAQQARVRPRGRRPAVIATLRVLALGASQADLDAIAPRLAAALGAVLAGKVASDPLNGLLLGAGLDWREIDCVRAYVEYFVQIQGSLTRPFLRDVLLENPLAVRLLVQLHAARFALEIEPESRALEEQRLQRAFEGYRDRIASLNEDRALSGLHALIIATLRTNFFAPASEPHRIVFKVDPALIAEIAPPRPWREIFVHSADQMGIHLRGGPVARGGLRWSDRLDDLRVEVLGLMRTQQLKNGVIVPAGAKGGFVLKRAGGLSPAEARAEADAQYRVFVTSLLEITDDLGPTGAVLPPAGVVRRDADDPYLVVAADKGTAHLSDTANAVALARGFWLGDAFASGGSEGYDHKKYAITARGAWECAKHHFAELGLDAERDVFSAVGIGDMSGDVFGNGALLMRRARLLAAFDHRHVFLDPDPDPESAWTERRRLFELPRSTWDDYDRSRISPGGGVFPRAAKSVDLEPAVRERLGLGSGRISGNDLIRAVLALDVDLLWNGGIGTYVKASNESNADVGDRANDAVRIDAPRLRARIVAEGGNLGLTQAARIEAALGGVRLETDAVDNSAGVDLSDHEVNYKILLAPLVRAGRIPPDDRLAALVGVADEACASVLSNNRRQALALSLDELRSRRSVDAFTQAADFLCEAAEVDLAALGLPGAKTIAERRAQGRGLVRPELAVLLGLAKVVTLHELGESDLADSPLLEPLFARYFPERLRAGWPDALRGHRLRREITALQVSNRLVDAGGASLIPGLVAELGAPIASVASALLLAEEVLEVETRRAALLALPLAGRAEPGTATSGPAADGVPREAVYAALLEIDRGVRAVARFFVKCGDASLAEETVVRNRAGVAELRASLGGFLSDIEAEQARARGEALVGEGIPPTLAADVAILPLADRGLNVLRLCEHLPVSPAEAARVYTRIGEGAGIHAVHRRLRDAEAAGLWDRMVLVDLRWELLDLQRALTERVLGPKPDDPLGAADRFLEQHASLLEGVRVLEQQIAPGDGPTALVVLTSRLRGLATPA